MSAHKSEKPAAPTWFGEVLRRELTPWAELSDAQVAQLYVHYEHLGLWNEKINLTSLKPGVEMVVRHYCESLFLASHLPKAGKARIADIGSGAGFPGVPIAVLHPDWAVTLIESHRRKSVFLREAARHLRNIAVLAVRAERVTDVFDWAVSRAVNPEDLLANVPRLARNVGLLIGELNYSALQRFTSIAWAEPIRLPWGDRRFCVFGVSRGTNL